VFEVSDTGVGIPEHEREAVFSPFIQGDKPRIDGEGTGLGLSIVKRLVEFLGGGVALQSTVGTGTTFSFDIPLQQFTGSIAERPETDTSGVYVDVTGYAGRTRSVLVADDADSNRRLLTDLLVPLGFSVDGASNGIEALENARQQKPDLVILDVVMPVSDGFEAFRSLRNDEELKDVPVIATSGSVAEQVRQECIRMGFAGFIEKPFHRDVVLGSIARVLNLEYTRRPSAGSREAPDKKPVRTPSGPEARAIASGLRRGDIRGILRAIEELARERPEYRTYCDTLTSLTRGFKLQAIADLIPEDSFES
jgi:CheY-like chemotaxis protein